MRYYLGSNIRMEGRVAIPDVRNEIFHLGQEISLYHKTYGFDRAWLVLLRSLRISIFYGLLLNEKKICIIAVQK